MSAFRQITGFAGRSVLLPYFRRGFGGYRSNLKHARELQERFLLDRIKRCDKTTFGRQHAFDDIASVKDFQSRVPIREYAEMKPYLDAVAAGDSAALIPDGERIVDFSCTTGTTGSPKVLPVTDLWLRNYQDYWRIWGTKTLIDNPGIFGKYWLQLTAPLDVGETASGRAISMLSSLSAKHQSQLFQSFYATPYALGAIEDPEIRHHAQIRMAMAQPVGFIITITAANLIRLAEKGDAEKEQIIREIHDGTIAGRSTIASHLGERRVARLTRPDPQRARQLAQLAEEHGRLLPKHYWPLQLVCCWTSGTVGYQTQRLTEYFGDTPIRDIGYVSTEGRHTIPEENGSPIGALVPTGTFYEFESVAEPGCILLPHEISEGEDYEVILTTSNGLYRYRIGDIVRCHGHVGESPLLEFVRKTDDYSDMEGEKLSGDQISLAMMRTRDLSPVTTSQASAVAMRPQQGSPYYAFVLEAHEIIDDATGQAFLNIVDKSLRDMNVMYRQKRRDRSLGPPILHLVEDGTWQRFYAACSAERRTGESQFKHPPFLESQFLSDNTICRTIKS